MDTVTDDWTAGSTYEEFMGRWSRLLAPKFVSWLQIPCGANWLDVGCGTGALTAAVCATAEPASIVGCDPSRDFIEYAREHHSTRRTSFVIADVDSLPIRTGGFDSVTSSLALNFFPDPGLAMEEHLSTVRRGGLVGAFVWDYAEGMEFLRHFWDAARVVEPRAAAMDEGHRFPVCDPEALEILFSSAGAQRVRVTSLSVPTTFSSFGDYWRPFLGGTGPAPSLVSSLTEGQRSALEGELRARLPIQCSGSIELQARAWAVVGHRS